jgi:hypothetical protein
MIKVSGEPGEAHRPRACRRPLRTQPPSRTTNPNAAAAITTAA